MPRANARDRRRWTPGVLKLGDDYKVDVSKLAVEELEMILGRGGVVFTGRG